MKSPSLLILTLFFTTTLSAQLPTLKISDNHRFLLTADNKPFFYLGDTAWELFHRSTREDADKYLANRAAKGFTVIQAVAIAEFDGATVPSAYGYLPLTDLDPTKPAVKDGPDNDYWDHVDYVVNKANALGLYVGFLPTWGCYWHEGNKLDRPLFNKANAESYGQWLGNRYKDKGIIWILGGDRGALDAALWNIGKVQVVARDDEELRRAVRIREVLHLAAPLRHAGEMAPRVEPVDPRLVGHDREHALRVGIIGCEALIGGEHGHRRRRVRRAYLGERGGRGRRVRSSGRGPCGAELLRIRARERRAARQGERHAEETSHARGLARRRGRARAGSPRPECGVDDGQQRLDR